MADPFIAEIRIFPFNFAPKGWAFCDGQLLPLSQNTALFSLVGTTYGGNGSTNFALPNLQGRAPMHPGQGPGLSPHDLGETGGSATVTLTTAQIPMHSHAVKADVAGAGQTSPTGNTWGKMAGRTPPPLYRTGAPDIPMSTTALTPTGGGQPHNNLSPYLAIYFNIALQGVFPSRS